MNAINDRRHLTSDEVRAIMRRHAAATEGPWEIWVERDDFSTSDTNEDRDESLRNAGDENVIRRTVLGWNDMGESDFQLLGRPDAEFVIAAHNDDIPDLCGTVERLREMVEQLNRRLLNERSSRRQRDAGRHMDGATF